jgi:hypothetical protein
MLLRLLCFIFAPQCVRINRDLNFCTVGNICVLRQPLRCPQRYRSTAERHTYGHCNVLSLETLIGFLAAEFHTNIVHQVARQYYEAMCWMGGMLYPCAAETTCSWGGSRQCTRSCPQMQLDHRRLRRPPRESQIVMRVVRGRVHLWVRHLLHLQSRHHPLRGHTVPLLCGLRHVCGRIPVGVCMYDPCDAMLDMLSSLPNPASSEPA